MNVYTIPSILIQVILMNLTYTDCKVFNTTELQAELLQKVSSNQLKNWICLAEAVSALNSSAVKNLESGRNYGIFQIGDRSWCANDENTKDSGCKINCSSLVDDDIFDDIGCALQIMQGDSKGSDYWPEWSQKCSGRAENHSISYKGNDEGAAMDKDKIPEILNLQNGTIKTFTVNIEHQYLLCQADGFPAPDLKWEYDETVFPKLYSVLSTKGLFLFLPTMNSGSEGDFVCRATNKVGIAEAKIHINVVEAEVGPSVFTFGFLSGVAFTILIICVIFGALACRNSKMKKKTVKLKGLSEGEIAEFRNGDPDGLVFNAFAHENARFQPYHKEYEILDEQMIIQTDKLLGSGAFGLVYQGKKDGTTVAVKTIKPGSDPLYIKALLSELKVMIYIGKHQNIVNLIGAKTTELDKGSLYIIVEYCALGSLETYIRSQRQEFVDWDGNNYCANRPEISIDMEYENVETKFTHQDLIQWSFQIAAGMNYLASRKVIHGDLAARNILLASKSVLKITDFGLSRQLYDYTNYVKKQQAPLPWRWMAIESLRSMTFSPQSDMWSFGVTLWEIFSLAEVPYAGLSWTLDFVDQLENGLRLLKPKHCSDKMYDKLVNCWHMSPEKRPSICQMYEWLEKEVKYLGS